MTLDNKVLVSPSIVKYGCTIDDILGNIDANGVLQSPANDYNLVFTGVKDIADYALYYKFYYLSHLKSVSFPDLVTVSGTYTSYYMAPESDVISASFPELTTISGVRGLSYMFINCRSLTSVSFPKLTTISGNYGLAYAFSGCRNLTSVSFPELTTLTGGSSLNTIFNACFNLESIFFPKLTTSSFGNATDQFADMMRSTRTDITHTIHFPSNLQSTIQGLQGYPNFGGTSGYVVLSFDLPATS